MDFAVGLIPSSHSTILFEHDFDFYTRWRGIHSTIIKRCTKMGWIAKIMPYLNALEQVGLADYQFTSVTASTPDELHQGFFLLDSQLAWGLKEFAIRGWDEEFEFIAKRLKRRCSISTSYWDQYRLIYIKHVKNILSRVLEPSTRSKIEDLTKFLVQYAHGRSQSIEFFIKDAHNDPALMKYYTLALYPEQVIFHIIENAIQEYKIDTVIALMEKSGFSFLWPQSLKQIQLSLREKGIQNVYIDKKLNYALERFHTASLL